MRQLFALVILSCFIFPTAAGAGENDRVFDERFLGDGVRYRNSTWDDVLYPVNINNFWGFASQSGNLVILAGYDWADYVHDGMARVVVGKRTGFISSDGQWAVQPQYTYADRFEEGMAIIGDGEKFGFLNRFGDELVPIELDGALRFREGLAAVEKRGRIAFYNTVGREMIGLNFARVRSFHQGLAMAQEPDQHGRRGRMGFIDTRGQYVFVDDDERYSDLGSFADGMAPAKAGAWWGFINRDFELVIKPAYQAVRGFYGGLAAVQVKGKWGYINKKGQTVIAPQFAAAYDFHDVLAMVKVDGRFGFIDPEGHLVISPQFGYAEPFFRDYARVAQKPNFGYIGINGQVIWDPRGPLDAIFDLTNVRPSHEATARINPPGKQKAVKVLYDPDYLYEDILPRPKSRRSRLLLGRSRR
jgi:hypothetical protein